MAIRKARNAVNSTAGSSPKMRAYTDYLDFSTVDGLISFGSLQNQRETIGFISTIVRPFTAEINESTLTTHQKGLGQSFCPPTTYPLRSLCEHSENYFR